MFIWLLLSINEGQTVFNVGGLYQIGLTRARNFYLEI